MTNFESITVNNIYSKK